MEEKREAAVWQRVAAQPELRSADHLEGLVREASELAAVYRQLGGQLTGRAKELSRLLQEEQQNMAACLRGLGLLSGGAGETVKIWQPAPDNRRRLLESCYHRTLRCRAEYASRCLDPECGDVFRLLADRASQQCARIAQLLGWLR